MPYIPLEVFANNATTTVSSGGTTAPAQGTQESWTVASSATFPAVETGAQQFHVGDPAQPSEMITVINVSGTTWTVARGAESTTPVAHSPGFTVTQVVTAGDLSGLQYPPWQFPVAAYGAQGDGKIGTSGTGASGQAVFTDAGASFVNAAVPAGDVGKYIIINQGTAGAATNPFVGTITGVNSATSVTLSANLAATCAVAPYIYGTDDVPAINAAVSAATAWATSTGNYKAQVVFEPLNYMLGTGPTQMTSPNNFNTQIPMPVGTQYGRKFVIDLVGVGDASEPDYWESTVPSLQGTCLVSAQWVTGQPNATYGGQSVIGGPNQGAGLAPGGFANTLINVDGITVVAPWNSQQIGFDFRWCAQANVVTASYLAFAPVNYNAQNIGGPYLAAGNIVSNGQNIGLYMPNVMNNDNCNVSYFTAEGAYAGMRIGEHFTCHRYACAYCNYGIIIDNNNTFAHGASMLYLSVESSNTSIWAYNISGSYPIYVGILDCEFMGTDIVDSGNTLSGTLNYWNLNRTTMAVTGAAGLNILNCSPGITPGPWAGAPAAPGSAVTQQNIAYRPATIYASATTGITNVSVGPVTGTQTALGLVAGNNVVIPVQVPSGHWYSVTYTGTLTTKWVLE